MYIPLRLVNITVPVCCQSTYIMMRALGIYFQQSCIEAYLQEGLCAASSDCKKSKSVFLQRSSPVSHFRNVQTNHCRREIVQDISCSNSMYTHHHHQWLVYIMEICYPQRFAFIINPHSSYQNLKLWMCWLRLFFGEMQIFGIYFLCRNISLFAYHFNAN